MKTERLKCGAVIRNTWKSCSKRIAIERYPFSKLRGTSQTEIHKLEKQTCEKYKFAPATGRDFILALAGLSIFATNVWAEEASAEEK